MATLVFSALGTALGGPFGGAVGALLGRQIDNAVLGTGSVEGPRLKELAVTTSSYGQPIARNFGQVRAAGSIIWATDLQESSESEGGGKGAPSTTTYSYSVSIAVALSSTPLSGLGRIWADGNLLRGEQGDMKVPGEMRVYLGHGDDPVDPLIGADRASQAPAFRDFAYVVFEDLGLSEFGNRIPALTFELFGENQTAVSLTDVAPLIVAPQEDNVLPQALGLSDEGGSLATMIAAIDRVTPLNCVADGGEVTLSLRNNAEEASAILPARLAVSDNSEANMRFRQRRAASRQRPLALRYYDQSRDYQPGIQHPGGQSITGSFDMIALPATMTASGARQLIAGTALRSRWGRDRLRWLIRELDPDVGPGSVVEVPDMAGQWVVKNWEWSDRGVELELERSVPWDAEEWPSDAGDILPPIDVGTGPTMLQFFEVPSLSSAANTEYTAFVGATSSAEAWNGAALYRAHSDSLEHIGSTGTTRAVLGHLLEPLDPSSGLMLEPAATARVQLAAADQVLTSTSIEALVNGANRLLVGGEVLQFLHAESLGSGVSVLTGLLRGRGGTEDAALNGHFAGEPVILLDSRITALSEAQMPYGAGSDLAAIGFGDPEPVYASISNAGLALRPPAPVRPIATDRPDGSIHLTWIRRARGQWSWDLQFEVPLVEEHESYQIGYGPYDVPKSSWITTESQFSIGEAERLALVAEHGPGDIWVRQIGTYSNSPPTHLLALE